MGKLDKLKTLIPMEQLEIEAQNQIYAALELDFLKKLAIMPDCHAGYSLPIGGVALLDGVISSPYVGYDIGCGMCTIVIKEIIGRDLSTKDREKIYQKIIDRIPTGFTMREKALRYEDFKSACGDKELTKKVTDKLYHQLGTLGGGNHFIEIGEGMDGIAVTIHSGSRNIGHSIGGYYMGIDSGEGLPKGFFRMGGMWANAYVQDMNYALEYALANRRVMMEEVLSAIGINADHYFKNMINENHNHAVPTADGVLHRKGATPADKGQFGIIPGNMRDGVFITVGLGNEEFLSSASHGAGRKMSRSKASKSLDMGEFEKQMKGIVCSTDKNILDEAPDAYKDVEKVIKAQEGVVVDVVNHFKPIINVKASEGRER